MPANIRDIKDRIDSVEKTEKITLAMKMVSAAKFKRNVVQLDHIKDFGTAMDSVLNSLSKRLNETEISNLLKPNDSPQVAVVVISSDRGLCGGFNANLYKEVNRQLEQIQQVDLYLVGAKSYQYFKRKDVKIVDHVPVFNEDEVGNSVLEDYVNKLVDSFEKGVYSKVYVIYNEFVSALSSNQVIKQMLPVELPEWDPSTTTHSDFIYESTKKNVLDRLCTDYISYLFRRAIYESKASEEGSRMAAMDSASTNANEMIDELRLYYNRSRQAAITTELTEIVAGAASLS